jgi:hypothetical protein
MKKNEPTASKRFVGPIPFFDNSGNLLAGQTFHTASGEVLVSLNGAALTAAANDAVEIGSGEYYYPASQAETNQDSFLLVVLRKSGYHDVGYQQDFDTIKDDTTSLISSTASLISSMTLLLQAAFGRWKIIGTQLVLYDVDNVTPIKTFDLKDAGGAPSSTSIFERDPL